MRKSFFIIMLLGSSLVWADSTMVESTNTHKANPSTQLIGGWSPMFFTNYDTNKVNQIITMIKENRIKAIKITYPTSNVYVAFKITQAIQKDTNQEITLSRLDLQGTPTTKYNKNQVVVTLYYGSPSRCMLVGKN